MLWPSIVCFRMVLGFTTAVVVVVVSLADEALGAEDDDAAGFGAMGGGGADVGVEAAEVVGSCGLSTGMLAKEAAELTGVGAAAMAGEGPVAMNGCWLGSGWDDSRLGGPPA